MKAHRVARSTTARPATDPTLPDPRARGKAVRKRMPRAAHATWEAPHDRGDPIALLERDDDDRLPELLPIRYRRMSASPFAFYRGAASIMANDLQTTASTGIHTQICGDAHLANFGAFATPERRVVFDVNDFDETIVGCWDYDLKRLCTSVAILAATRGFRKRVAEDAVLACARSYRQRIAALAQMNVLDVWYARIDEAVLEQAAPDAVEAASGVHDPSRAAQQLYAHAVAETDGAPRIVDRPPLVFHPEDAAAFVALVRDAFARYKRSLSFERRELVNRFSFRDAAYKVVGVGSVGTRCAVALLLAGSQDPLFLQFKEARESVYARYGARTACKNEGERVVVGQRAMQATSDLFLGWTRAKDGRTYYVRQLRDVKTGVDLDRVASDELAPYASLCGWALARAHAKASGNAATIAGYLGSSAAFDEAMVAFASAYAKQNASDYEALLAAIASGRIKT
jgi:uncharacterized protein (DUF2252 family)